MSVEELYHNILSPPPTPSPRKKSEKECEKLFLPELSDLIMVRAGEGLRKEITKTLYYSYQFPLVLLICKQVQSIKTES